MIARMRNPADEFGTRLRQLRREKGIATDKLSEQVGVARTLIAKWEREPRGINKTVLHRVAEALGLSHSELQELIRLADLRSAPAELRHLLRTPPGR